MTWARSTTIFEIVKLGLERSGDYNRAGLARQ